AVKKNAIRLYRGRLGFSLPALERFDLYHDGECQSHRRTSRQGVLTKMDRSKVILVTGATGFLGQHLCNYFRRKGDDVRGLVRRTDAYPFLEAGVKLFKGDLPDRI